MSNVQAATNITWHEPLVRKKDREQLNGHQSVVIWFTGLSGAGKSTLANAVASKLHADAVRTYVLDGDNIRHGLNRDLGFSAEDRQENIRRIGEVSKLFVDAGVVVLTAFISPYLEDRQQARNIVGDSQFIEVYVKCDLAECERRDPKGLYEKARRGQIQGFTGIDAPYEAPQNPELTIETDRESQQQSVQEIVDHLKRRAIIKGNGQLTN